MATKLGVSAIICMLAAGASDPHPPACHVPSLALVQWEDAQWLVVFYACQIGGEHDYDYRYDRIRYMRRRVPNPDDTRQLDMGRPDANSTHEPRADDEDADI